MYGCAAPKCRVTSRYEWRSCTRGQAGQRRPELMGASYRRLDSRLHDRYQLVRQSSLYVVDALTAYVNGIRRSLRFTESLE